MFVHITFVVKPVHIFMLRSRTSKSYLMAQCSCAVHHMLKCMIYHKTIVVITRMAHCFHDYIYCLNYTSLLLHLIPTHIVSHFSFSSVIFIISTLIIGIFYSLNYTSLLLHLIIIHLVNMFYNKYVINICPRQLL